MTSFTSQNTKETGKHDFAYATLGTWNIRSIKKKTGMLSEFLVEKQVHILTLTETMPILWRMPGSIRTGVLS